MARIKKDDVDFARSPKGGGTDRIWAIASGERSIAIGNTDYLARIMRSNAPEDQRTIDRVGVVLSNQAMWGKHINIARGAVARNAKTRAIPSSSWNT